MNNFKNSQWKNQNKTEEFDNRTDQNNQKPNSLITIIGQLLPFAPIVYEQFTGQKVPQMSGTIVEMQTALLQISTNLQTIAQNQQSLNQRLLSLESNANNLTHQFKNLRLTHTKEHKQIEYNPNQITETEPENY